MAKITPYDQRTEAPVASEASSPFARAARVGPASAFGTEGGDQLARGLYNLGDALREREEEQARAWSANMISDARLKWTTHLIERQQTAKPGAEGFTPEFIKDFDEYARQTVEAAPTRAAKLYLSNRLGEMRAQFGESALRFEAQARIDWRADQFTNATENRAKLMNRDPSQYSIAMAEGLAEIDGASIPPVKKSELRQKAIDRISMAAVWTQIQRDPSGFLTSIGFGADKDGRTRKSDGTFVDRTGNLPFDALQPERRAQMFDQAIKLKAQLDADQERIARENHKQLEDQYAKDAWDMILGPKASAAGARAAIEKARPFVSQATYHSLMFALQTKLKGDGTGPKTDPAALRDILEMQDKDPKGAVDLAFKYHKQGRLSNSDLTGEVTRTRSQARQEGPKSSFEQARTFIQNSLDPGPFVQDPLGRQRWAEANQAFQDWYGAGQGGRQPDKETHARAREIVDQYKFINFNDTVLALPQPRGTKITRQTGDLDKMEREIGESARTIMSRKNRMQPGEYEIEMDNLNRWRRALENARSAKVKKP